MDYDPLSLPIGANPEKDQIVGYDELGEPMYRSLFGDTYHIVRQAAPERVGAAGSMDRAKSMAGSMLQGIWDGFTVPGRAASGEVPTMGGVLNTAGLAMGGAAPNAIPNGAMGSLAMRRFPVDEASTYIRRSQHPDTPDNGVGYSMFAHDKGDPVSASERLDTYGDNAWIADASGAVDVRDIQADILKSMRTRGQHTEYQTTAAQLARTANPDDIVNSAGLWDDPALVQNVWDDVLEPNGVTKVKTNDGLLLFDPSMARRYSGQAPPSNKAQITDWLKGLK